MTLFLIIVISKDTRHAATGVSLASSKLPFINCWQRLTTIFLQYRMYHLSSLQEVETKEQFLFKYTNFLDKSLDNFFCCPLKNCLAMFPIRHQQLQKQSTTTHDYFILSPNTYSNKHSLNTTTFQNTNDRSMQPCLPMRVTSRASVPPSSNMQIYGTIAHWLWVLITPHFSRRARHTHNWFFSLLGSSTISGREFWGG